MTSIKPPAMTTEAGAVVPSEGIEHVAHVEQGVASTAVVPEKAMPVAPANSAPGEIVERLTARSVEHASVPEAFRTQVAAQLRSLMTSDPLLSGWIRNASNRNPT